MKSSNKKFKTLTLCFQNLRNRFDEWIKWISKAKTLATNRIQSPPRCWGKTSLNRSDLDLRTKPLPMLANRSTARGNHYRPRIGPRVGSTHQGVDVVYHQLTESFRHKSLERLQVSQSEHQLQKQFTKNGIHKVMNNLIYLFLNL